jgi:hypothetical protein
MKLNELKDGQRVYGVYNRNVTEYVVVIRGRNSQRVCLKNPETRREFEIFEYSSILENLFKTKTEAKAEADDNLAEAIQTRDGHVLEDSGIAYSIYKGHVFEVNFRLDEDGYTWITTKNGKTFKLFNTSDFKVWKYKDMAEHDAELIREKMERQRLAELEPAETDIYDDGCHNWAMDARNYKRNSRYNSY